MKKNYLILAVFWLVSLQTYAQITKEYPSGENTGRAPWSVELVGTTGWKSDVRDIKNMFDGDPSTEGRIGIARVSGEPSKPATLIVNFEIPKTNNGVIYVETDDAYELNGYSNAKVTLWNGSSQYKEDEVVIENRMMSGKENMTVIHTPGNGPITKMSISYEVEAGWDTKGILIKELYWYEGVSSNTDCGRPIATSYEIGGGGVLVGIPTWEQPNSAIDDDPNTSANDGNAGLGSIPLAIAYS